MNNGSPLRFNYLLHLGCHMSFQTIQLPQYFVNLDLAVLCGICISSVPALQCPVEKSQWCSAYTSASQRSYVQAAGTVL